MNGWMDRWTNRDPDFRNGWASTLKDRSLQGPCLFLTALEETCPFLGLGANLHAILGTEQA